MLGVLNPRIHIHIPLEKWDWFETSFKKDKITHKQTNEQSQENEIQLYFLEQFSPVFPSKCHKMLCKSQIKGSKSVI